jgi:FkbM family methyltransferase
MLLNTNARILNATFPLTLEIPSAMSAAVQTVLAGEYEAGFSGENLIILDIGANVGSFSIWADLRWPNSAIHAYEPNPGTFDILRRNVADLRNVQTYNAALWPTDEPQALFFSRYAGDGEAGLTAYMHRTFTDLAPEGTFYVSVTNPNALPRADIIKLDVEGAEFEILRHLDVSETSLILLEYQSDQNREAIKGRLADDFVLEFEDRLPWKDLLDATPLYRRDLDGDHYGRLFFSRRNSRRLHRIKDGESR